jgi:hypothetical protein
MELLAARGVGVVGGDWTRRCWRPHGRGGPPDVGAILLFRWRDIDEERGRKRRLGGCGCIKP